MSLKFGIVGENRPVVGPEAAHAVERAAAAPGTGRGRHRGGSSRGAVGQRPKRGRAAEDVLLLSLVFLVDVVIAADAGEEDPAGDV